MFSARALSKNLGSTADLQRETGTVIIPNAAVKDIAGHDFRND